MLREDARPPTEPGGGGGGWQACEEYRMGYLGSTKAVRT